MSKSHFSDFWIVLILQLCICVSVFSCRWTSRLFPCFELLCCFAHLCVNIKYLFSQVAWAGGLVLQSWLRRSKEASQQVFLRGVCFSFRLWLPWLPSMMGCNSGIVRWNKLSLPWVSGIDIKSMNCWFTVYYFFKNSPSSYTLCNNYCQSMGSK